MTDVFCYTTLENDEWEVRSWNNIVPSPGRSSDKILYFLLNPLSFLISKDPVMSKFVPVTPTVVINMFSIDVYYSKDILKTQILLSAAGCSTIAMSIFSVELRIRELQTAPPGIKSVSSQSFKSKLARIAQHYRAKVS